MSRPLIIYLVGGPVGGTRASAVQLLRMVDAFKRVGCDVCVIENRSLTSPVPTTDFQKEAGLRDRVRLKTVRTFRSRPHLWIALHAWVRCRRSAPRGPVILYCRNPASAGFKAALLIKSLKKRVKLVTEVHTFELIEPFDPRVDCYAPISVALQDDLEERGVPRDRLVLARDGVDLDLYKDLWIDETKARLPSTADKSRLRDELGLPLDAAIVTFTGHLYPDRGVVDLLKAIRELKDALLVLVGGIEPDLQAMQRAATELGISDRVVFTGFIPPRKVPQYQIASDVLVIPYSSTLKNKDCASPLKLFEYMASGNPIVATDLRSHVEVLRTGENALLVPPDDPPALSRAIASLLDDSALGRRLAEAAQRDVGQFTWTARAKRILNAID